LKRALEIGLLVGVLAIGAFVLHAWLRRRAPAVRPRLSPSAAPGSDRENPDGPPPLVPPPHSVTSLPVLKEARPPKRPSVEAVVPPPVSAAP